MNMLKRLGQACCVAVLMLASLIGLGIEFSPTTKAAQLPNRSLAVTSSLASNISTDTFSFIYPDTQNVGSLTFDFCTTPWVGTPCVPPNGVSVLSATLAGQSGETGFVIEAQNTDDITLSRSPQPTLGESSQYIFNNITNPDNTVTSYFVRIATYPTSDGTGPVQDYGTVVNSNTTGVGVNSQVPQILNFCVGVTIPGDCSTASGNFIDLGNLSDITTARATSQFQVGTNAQYGVSVSLSGNTLYSGNNPIPPISPPNGSLAGNSQFGFNLRANSSPLVGQEPSGGSVVPTASYNTPNVFNFNSGDVIASTAGTTYNTTLTASYIVNVAPDQPVGVYDTTLTFICTAAF